MYSKMTYKHKEGKGANYLSFSVSFLIFTCTVYSRNDTPAKMYETIKSDRIQNRFLRTIQTLHSERKV